MASTPALEISVLFRWNLCSFFSTRGPTHYVAISSNSGAVYTPGGGLVNFLYAAGEKHLRQGRPRRATATCQTHGHKDVAVLTGCGKTCSGDGTCPDFVGASPCWRWKHWTCGDVKTCPDVRDRDRRYLVGGEFFRNLLKERTPQPGHAVNLHAMPRGGNSEPRWRAVSGVKCRGPHTAEVRACFRNGWLYGSREPYPVMGPPTVLNRATSTLVLLPL
jgi:hypothetical protein